MSPAMDQAGSPGLMAMLSQMQGGGGGMPAPPMAGPPEAAEGGNPLMMLLMQLLAGQGQMPTGGMPQSGGGM